MSDDPKPFQSCITSEITPEVCPKCGLYHMSKLFVPADGSAVGDDFVLCVGCGYYRFMQATIIVAEGISFLVHCPHCKKCQTWIKYPMSIMEEHKDVQRLLYWTCDNCKVKSRVSDSTVSPESSQNHTSVVP